MKVVLASKNKHKLVEISQITEKFGFELVLQSELGVDIDVEETGTTFEENSFLKAEAVMKATGPVLLGGIFMVLADMFARIVVAPSELPIGVVTALLGAPFFLFLLRKSRYSFSRR